MSPFAPQVVAAAAVIASPVFYQALVARSATLDFALTRFLVIWVVTWVVVGLVVELLFPTRLETERRVRDLLLAEREVRKALEEADAEAARAADADAEGGGLDILDSLHAEEESAPEAAADTAAPQVPAPRQATRDGAVSGTRATP